MCFDTHFIIRLLKKTPIKNQNIGTLKMHFKENRSMSVVIQYVKDIFYFSTKGKLFF